MPEFHRSIIKATNYNFYFTLSHFLGSPKKIIFSRVHFLTYIQMPFHPYPRRQKSFSSVIYNPFIPISIAPNCNKFLFGWTRSYTFPKNRLTKNRNPTLTPRRLFFLSLQRYLHLLKKQKQNHTKNIIFKNYYIKCMSLRNL